MVIKMISSVLLYSVFQEFVSKYFAHGQATRDVRAAWLIKSTPLNFIERAREQLELF